jgi:two-component system response regulator
MPGIDFKTMFGRSVKDWRHQRGISQEELAERSDLHRTYISDVERGARNLSLESISKLARALEISVSDLFSWEFPIKKDGDAKSNGHRRKPVEVLLVEDNPDDVKLTLRAFKQGRFANQVYVVQDGAEALDYLYGQGKYASRRATESAQVVLLDLSLPKVNGMEVLKRIKGDPRTKTIPVVILASSKEQKDVIESYHLGVNSYVVKPVNFEQFAIAVQELGLYWLLHNQPPK